MSFKSLLVLAALVAVALAGKAQNEYNDQQQRGYGGYEVPQVIRVPAYNYGPDNARYRLTANLYDNYVYQRTNLHVDRFPGGVDYHHDLKGYGADVRVNFKSYPSGRKIYNNKEQY